MATTKYSNLTGIPVVQYQAGEHESTTSYTIGATTTPPTTGSGATMYRNTIRDGEYAIIRWEYLQSNAGTAGSGTYTLTMPTGLTVNYSKLNVVGSSITSLTGSCGYGRALIGTTQYSVVPCTTNTGTAAGKIVLTMFPDGTASVADWGNTIGLDNATTRVSVTARVPIAEWAGQAYVAYGAGEATTTVPGLVGTGTQTFAGNKTFNGTVQLGSSVTNNYTGSQHLISGYLYAGNVTSTVGSGQLGIGTNVRISSGAAETGRTNTTTGGAGIRFTNHTSASGNAIEFFSNQPGESTSTGATQIMTGSHAGAWTLGTTSSDVTHIVQNSSTANQVFRIRNHSTSTSSDSTEALVITKGSTTNTSTQKFINFQINAAGTASGYIGANGANQAAFFSTSDRRVKKDIIDLAPSLSKIMALRPVSFRWKQDDSEDVSFIAQEVAAIFPKQVNRTDNGTDELTEGQEPWSITESGFVPYLVKAIQEQQVIIESLKARIEALEVE